MVDKAVQEGQDYITFTLAAATPFFFNFICHDTTNPKLDIHFNCICFSQFDVLQAFCLLRSSNLSIEVLLVFFPNAFGYTPSEVFPILSAVELSRQRYNFVYRLKWIHPDLTRNQLLLEVPWSSCDPLDTKFCTSYLDHLKETKSHLIDDSHLLTALT